MKNNASLVYNICLVIGDFLALIAAFVVAFILRVSLSTAPITHPITARTYLGIFLLVLPFWILIFGLLGLYSQRIYEKRFVELGRLFIGSFIGLLFVIFISFLSSTPIFPAKLVPVYGFGLGFILLVVFRNMARLMRSELFNFTVGLNNVILVGNNSMTTSLVNMLASRRSGYNIVSVVGSKRVLGKHTVLPLYETFSQTLQHIKLVPHTIIQTELYADEKHNRELLEYAQTNHVAYRFVPGNTELFIGNIDVELFQGSIPVIAVNQTALIGWGRIVKRLFDLSFGILLLVITLPITIVVCLIMILFDHGDPIFRQARLSRYGNIIHIYKFRTQLHAYNRMTPEQGFAKMNRPGLAIDYRANGDYLEDDPRISKIGRFLRKTSLDELPQLLNVIKGEMSLVGPRPLEPFELANYGKKDLMLSVKTGLTGLAVVSGRRDIPFEERRKLDLYYVQNWSFWLDVSIIIKTIRSVIKGTGAR